MYLEFWGCLIQIWHIIEHEFSLTMVSSAQGGKLQGLILIFGLACWQLDSLVWSNRKHKHVSCENSKPPLHIYWDWTIQWCEKSCLSSYIFFNEHLYHRFTIFQLVDITLHNFNYFSPHCLRTCHRTIIIQCSIFVFIWLFIVGLVKRETQYPTMSFLYYYCYNAVINAPLAL